MSNLTPQQKFNKDYITASEIMEQLGISRAALLYARVRGRITEPQIVVNHGRLLIWERKDVDVLLAEWKNEIDSRKSV